MARRILGVDEIEVVGEHGLALDPAAETWAERIHAFADAAGWPAERKRLTVAFHWRTHPEGEPIVRRLGTEAEQAGFHVRWGRKVIDVMPPVAANKGTAVRHLLGRHPEVRRALFAGDDTTDLDAFAGLRAASLELAVCVGVVTPESPAALRDESDLVVDGPDAVRELLARL